MRRKEQRKRRDEILDRAMQVQRSDERIGHWDREAIVRSLKKELGDHDGLMREIALAVEKQIAKMELATLTGPLIRELVCVELLQRGMEGEYKRYQRLGLPIYDVRNIILAHNEAVSSNNPHTPETTNMTIAGSIKKDYALAEIFSREVREAHLNGDIHLHKLDFPDRPYCCGNSLEYVKKYGLNVAASLAVSAPAKHASVLILQMIKFACMLQINFSGAIGWEAVNVFLAPFLVGMSEKEIYDVAQMLIYEFNMQNVAKGGQAVFSDINLYWEVPQHYRETPAIGPGGKLTGKTYKDYKKEAQTFLTQLMKVYLKGDACGRPFFWPKPNFHMTEKFWSAAGHEEFLKLACQVASEKGNTEFFFDRGDEVRVSQCCRLSFKLDKTDLLWTKKPYLMRQSSSQYVSINLPRIAYQAEHNDKKLFELLEKRMGLAAKAHQQKHKFLQKMMSFGLTGPLAALCTTQKDDPDPYLRLARTTYLFTIAGLNEMMQYHLGRQLHESDEAIKFGLKVIAFMKKTAEELGRKMKMRFATEQDPMEGLTYRFARLDLDNFPQAVGIVRGDYKTKSVYYTNSCQLNVAAEIDPIERIRKEGLFHPLIEAGSMTHLWLGEQRPDPGSIANLVKKTFFETTNSLIAFSPEFTFCVDCQATTRGLVDKCSSCGSSNVDHATRVSGFYSLTSRWNKGKLQELKERYRNTNQF